MNVRFRVKIDDRRLMNLIHRCPKIGHELVKKAGYVGFKNARQGIIDGRSEWKPLSERRIAEKGHDHILIETQALLKSLFTDAEGNRSMYGTNISYAGVHEFGLGGIPRRAILLPTVMGEELEEMKHKLESLARVLWYKYSR